MKNTSKISVTRMADEPIQETVDQVKWMGLTEEGQHKLDQLYKRPGPLDLFGMLQIYKNYCIVAR